MPETRTMPHVHLEIGCHCPTETMPTELEHLRAFVHKVAMYSSDGWLAQEADSLDKRVLNVRAR